MSGPLATGGGGGVPESSLGGNGSSDSGKLAKFGSDGSLKGSAMKASGVEGTAYIGNDGDIGFSDGDTVTSLEQRPSGSFVKTRAMTDRGDGVPDNLIPSNSAAVRTALGAGDTGAELFQAATAETARNQLGITTLKLGNDLLLTSNAYSNCIGPFPLAANTSYRIDFFASYTCVSSTVGVKMQFLLTTAAHVFGNVAGAGIENRGGDAVQNISWASSGTVAALGATTTRPAAAFTGFLYLRTGAHAGTMYLQAAQNTTDAVNVTTIKSGSVVTVTSN